MKSGHTEKTWKSRSFDLKKFSFVEFSSHCIMFISIEFLVSTINVHSIMLLHFLSYKIDVQNKNISKQKYMENAEIYLKWKNWLKLFLEKGSSPQLKGNFVWQKGNFVWQMALG